MKMDSVWILVNLCIASLTVSVCRADCSFVSVLEAGDEPKEVRSPNYPSDYPTGLRCWWDIYGDYYESDILIDVLDVDIETSTECSADSLAIYGLYHPFAYKTICGNITSNETINVGSAAYIEFRTDGQNSGRGFRLQYREQKRNNKDDDRYHKKRRVQAWGIVLFVVIAVVVIATIVAVFVGCYCKRRTQRKDRNQTSLDLVTTISKKVAPPDVKTEQAQYLGKTDVI